MRAFSAMIVRLSTYMSVISGSILLFMAALTLADVILRLFRKPILGTYEVVAFLGAAVAGFALPRGSLKGANINVDLVSSKLPAKAQRVLLIVTKLLGVLLFLFGAIYLALMGRNFYLTKTVTMTLRVPFYPVVFGLAFSCLVQCLVSLSQILDDKGAKNG
jgi:TRAP-type C4-dicarboxylate transport system permease small subunit